MSRPPAAAPLTLALALALAASSCSTAAAPPPPVPVALEQDPVPPARLEEIPLAMRDGDQALEGLLVFDPARKGPRPGVVVVHEWWGLNDHAKEAARRMARLGYVALAADMYGKGKSTTEPAQAREWASQFRGEGASRGRARAAVNLAALRARPEVDGSRMAILGFCFGGTVSLEAAWSGADLRAAISFHGNPTAPTDAEGAAVKASVLLLHGNADPAVKEEALTAFRQAIEKHTIDAAAVFYAGAEHAFTNPAANRPGARYQETAARRSWEHAEAFLAERLRSGGR